MNYTYHEDDTVGTRCLAVDYGGIVIAWLFDATWSHAQESFNLSWTDIVRQDFMHSCM